MVPWLLGLGLLVNAAGGTIAWTTLRSAPYQDLQASLELYGARGRADSRWLGQQSFWLPRTLTAHLARRPDLHLEPVARGVLESPDQGEIRYGLSAHQIQTIRLDRVHDEGFLGAGVTIGVLDTGFDSTHPAVRWLFDNGRIAARHDFNSGDHLYWGAAPLPQPYNNQVRIYINGFAATPGAVVRSAAPRDSLTGINAARWRLWLSRVQVNNGIPQFEAPVQIYPGPWALQPSVAQASDGSLFIVFQNGAPNPQVYFGIYGDTGWLTDPWDLSESPDPALSPAVTLHGDTLVRVYWLSPAAGILRRTSTDGGHTFGPADTLFAFPEPIPFPDPLRVFAAPDRDLVAFVDPNGEVQVLDCPTAGAATPWLVGPGREPDVALDSLTGQILVAFLVDTFLWTGTLSAEQFNLKSTAVRPFARYPRLYYRSGWGWRVALASGGYLLDFPMPDPSAGSPDTLSGYGADRAEPALGFLLYRRRGDGDVTPEGMVPGYNGGANYHGTKVLSVLAGYDVSNDMVGAALGASFVLVNTEIAAINGQFFENVLEEDFWVEGLEFAAAHGARIINSSLGYRDWYTDPDLDGETPVSSRAASQALDQNVLVVTAVGNQVPDQGHFTDPITGDTSLVAPADARGVISVGAYERDSVTGDLLPLSLFGPTADGRIKPEVVAPYFVRCGGLYTPQGDTLPFYYFTCGGTSFGTALVSGALACIWEAHPSWTAARLREAVLGTARPVTDIPGYPEAPDSNNITGYGLLDAYAALHLEPPETPAARGDALLPPYPNPVNFARGEVLHLPYVLAHNTYRRIQVFSLSGKLVFDSGMADQSIGRYHTGSGANPDVVWDGRDRSGNPVPPGVYLVVLKTGFNTSTRKVAVIH